MSLFRARSSPALARLESLFSSRCVRSFSLPMRSRYPANSLGVSRSWEDASALAEVSITVFSPSFGIPARRVGLLRKGKRRTLQPPPDVPDQVRGAVREPPLVVVLS